MTAIAEYSWHREVRGVKRVQFGILSPERILKMSVAEVFRVNMDEKTGTLRDPYMGSPNRGSLNPLTGLTGEDDPGHFGHLVLAKPVINVLFWDTIIKVLNSVCYRCSNILSIDPKKPHTLEALQRIRPAARLETLTKRSKSNRNIKCPHCGTTQPKFVQSKSGGSLINANWDAFEEASEDASGKRFTAEQILNVFSRLSDNTVRLLGFDPTLNHPAWMIWTVFPIPPPAIRPSITLEGVKGNSEDDLTLILTQIIALNTKLRARIAEIESSRQAPAQKMEQINNTWEMLEHACAAFIDNENDAINKLTNNSQRPYRGIKQRIQPAGRNKESIIRAHLMGKRVNWSARSVITGAAYLSMGQIGVPQVICETLIYPEVVNQYNRAKLQALVRQGSRYPGAKWVIKNFKRGNITYKKRHTLSPDEPYLESLRDGDVVMRHLIQGDLVIFNRQPTLHKMSMMVHEVVPVTGLSLCLPVIDTSPYGADFDGDESNIHILLSQMTLAEGQLMKVQRMIVSPQNSAPVIGLKEDTLTAAFRFTASLPPTVRFSLPQFYQLAGIMINYSGMIPHPDEIERTQLIEQVGFSPRDVVTQMLPPITIHLKSKADIEDRDLMITNGTLKSGKLNKALVSNKARGGLPHLIWKDLGSVAARSMLDDFSRVMSHWIHIYEGFSVSLADFAIPRADRLRAADLLSKGLREAKDFIESFRQGTTTVQASHLVDSLDEQMEQEMEAKLGTLAKSLQKEVEKILRKDKLNRAFDMVDSGSKGEVNNLMQIVAALGYTTLGGRRLVDTLLRRVFVHFPKDDASPEQRGFIENPYLEGLAPTEFAAYQQIGRESQINTSISTADTGYISRQLMKTLESIKVEYDYTVTNAVGHILQYSYGGDSCDGAYLERVHVPYLGLSNQMFELRYRHLMPPKHQAAFNESTTSKWMDQEYLQLLTDRQQISQMAVKLGIRFGRLMLPVNWQRLVDNAVINFGLNLNRSSNLTADQIIQTVSRMLDSIKVSQHPTVNEQTLLLFKICTRAYLASKPLLEEYRFSVEAFNYLINQGQATFYQSLIQPGECVGPLTATSIGEPTTQLTLSTFHAAGSAEKRGMQGVPRAKEIISVSQRPNKVQLTDIYLKPDLANPPPNRKPNQTDEQWNQQKEDWMRSQDERARQVINQIQLQTVGKLVDELKIIFDPNSDQESVVEEDRSFLEAYRKIEEQFKRSTQVKSQTSPWVLRMQFNRDNMIKSQITMYDIEVTLKNALEQYPTAKFLTQFSDENAKQLIGRVSLRANSSDHLTDPVKVLKEVNEFIGNLVIRGIKGVKQGRPRANKNLTYIDSESGELRALGHPRYNDSCANQEMAIEMAGINLADIMTIPEVDQTRCSSNDFWETYYLMGIEATRKKIIDEFSAVIDKHVTNRHINLLADQMTTTGRPVSITRTGLRKSQLSILDRMSYETAMQQATTGALRGESDPINSVTARIMTGLPINGGTGFFEVVFNEKMVADLVPPQQTQERSMDQQSVRQILERVKPTDLQQMFSLEAMRMTFED